MEIIIHLGPYFEIVEPAAIHSNFCKHLMLVRKVNDLLILLKSNDIEKKGILVEIGDDVFISSFPNKIEKE